MNLTPHLVARIPAPPSLGPALAAATAMALIPAALPLRAEGFRAPTTGAYGLGATGGRIAFVDDASAVFHNPANLVELDAWEAAAEPTFVHHSVRYESPAGATAETTDPWKVLPHFFAGGPIGDGRFAAGLGVSVPFGLSVDWEDGGPLRFVGSRYVQLKTINFNPSLAARLGDKVRIGVGIDAMWSELTLSQYYPWAFVAGVPGLPDGDLRAEGTGIGVSGNAGVTWQIAERHRLAATVRAPMDVEYQGDFRASGAPTVPGGNLLLPFESEIGFPTMVTLGYGIELSECLRLEANVEWLEFSRFQSLDLRVPGSLPGVPTSIRQDWKDTFTAGLAATWQFAQDWHARASYQFFETPVPDETFSNSIPDANQHAVALGIGWRHGRHRLDAAYSKVFYEDRTITGNQVPFFNGRWEFDVHLMSLGYGLTF